MTTRTVKSRLASAVIGLSLVTLAGTACGTLGGAAVGAGAGAGSVFIQGREDLDLMSGAEFTIRASAPR